MESSQATRSAICPNCGTQTVGPFCHACGQEQESKIVPLIKFIRQAFSEFLVFDNRIFRTLKLLLLKPGQLTLEWWNGRRTSYIPPIRLYIIFSVIDFAVLSLTGISIFLMGTIKLDIDDAAIFQEWLPRILIVLLPLVAAFFHVINYRHKRYYIEHLVFTIHIYCFYFIIDMTRVLISYSIGYTGEMSEIPIFWSIVLVLLALSPLVYLGVAMKRAYPQPTWSVVLKVFAIVMVYFLFIFIVVGILMTFFNSAASGRLPKRCMAQRLDLRTDG